MAEHEKCGRAIISGTGQRALEFGDLQTEVQEDGGVLPPTEKQVLHLLNAIGCVEGQFSALRVEIEENTPKRLSELTVGAEPGPQN
jgi:hypothetical protein